MNRLLTALLAFILAGLSASAQLSRGYISGTVTDASGAVIADADVTITNSATNIQRTMKTTVAGIYRFPAVEPGDYFIEFAKSGFGTRKVGPFTVGTTQEVVLNQSLEVASTVTTIEVIETPASVVLSKASASILTGEVKGINQLQAEYAKKYGAGNYIPPITLSFWSFRVMVGVGTLMALLAALGVFLLWQKKFETTPLVLRLLPWAILLPYIANTAGWLLTELGRQPWIVFGLMKTENAVSKSVTGGDVLLSLILFTLIYGVLMAFDIYLLIKYARRDPMEKVAVAAY